MNIFHRLYFHPKSKAKISHSGGFPEVNNWLISEFVFKKIIPIVGLHPYPLSELQLMIGTVCWWEPDIIVEWGTHLGKSARIFSETCRHFEIKSQIYSIDLPPNVSHIENPREQRGMYVSRQSNVTLLLGDGVTVSKRIIKKHSHAKTLFFLDGDHEYKSVARELKLISALKPDAAIIVHDTFFQAKSSHYNIGPYLAVKELLKRYKNKYHCLQSALGLPGMTVLLPKSNK